MSETADGGRGAADPGAPYRELLAALDAGRSAVLLAEYGPDGRPSRRRCIPASDLGLPADGLRAAAPGAEPLLEFASRAFASGLPELAAEPGGRILAFAEPFFPPPRLLILGAGHIAAALARFAAELGFETTVCDDRPSFADPARFPAGATVACAYFRQFIDTFPVGSSTYAVIATRGHRHDTECYRALARRGAAYVGMVGSRRRIAELKRLLREEGFEAGILDQLRAPIGLDIGAAGPAEIALSIAAEIVSCLRKGPGAAAGKSEIDLAVLKELAGSGSRAREGRAMVTVVSTSGSAPRGPGAKLVVWADGRILGSVGGGCAEGEVLLAARDRIRDGGSELVRVDLSNSLAEEEGMACGGTMEFLVEAVEASE